MNGHTIGLGAPQSPSPGSGPGSSNGNGNVGAAGVGGGGGIFPTSAGYQMDLNHLWGLVQELSTQLRENREATQQIVSRVAEVRRRASATGGEGENGMHHLLSAVVNGEGVPTMDLQTRVDELTEQNTALDGECNDFSILLADYEAGIGKLLDMVRNYSFEHNQVLNQTHRYYQNLLTTERAEKMRAFNEKYELQAGVRRVSKLLREGMSTTPMEQDLIKQNGSLRHENRVLRKMVGWPVEDEDDEQGEGF